MTRMPDSWSCPRCAVNISSETGAVPSQGTICFVKDHSQAFANPAALFLQILMLIDCPRYFGDFQRESQVGVRAPLVMAPDSSAPCLRIVVEVSTAVEAVPCSVNTLLLICRSHC